MAAAKFNGPWSGSSERDFLRTSATRRPVACIFPCLILYYLHPVTVSSKPTQPTEKSAMTEVCIQVSCTAFSSSQQQLAGSAQSNSRLRRRAVLTGIPGLEHLVGHHLVYFSSLQLQTFQASIAVTAMYPSCWI